ncbi:unnamed protein product [Zymoseptoria tritici ST99CH_3D7]|uniref:Uncharacterized protein n=1 Tax=Zymoseptoria tritici (strain ST99CH_3D7) TaxID=1276538 RepID=A0A1X7S380_ZYMT9|nr:unnamed protein product [Zymoseptoria tritici ST99CH_3D7]
MRSKTSTCNNEDRCRLLRSAASIFSSIPHVDLDWSCFLSLRRLLSGSRSAQIGAWMRPTETAQQSTRSLTRLIGRHCVSISTN